MSRTLKITLIVAVAAVYAASETDPVPETSFSEAVEGTKQEKAPPTKLSQMERNLYASGFPKNLAWPTSDGFMSMAHMVNSKGSVKWARKDWANAIEVDVAFCGVKPCEMRHSAPEVDGKMAGGVTFSGKVNPTPGMACDCSCYNGATVWAAEKKHNVCGHLYKDASVGAGKVGCQAKTGFVEYLNDFAKKNHFRMLYLDNKVAAGWNKAQQVAAGANEARMVIEELFEKGYTGKVMFDGATQDWKHFIQSAIHEFGTYKKGLHFDKVYFTYGFMDYDGKVWKQQRMVRAAINAMRQDFCTHKDHGKEGDETQEIAECPGSKCPLNGQYCTKGYTCIKHTWVKVKVNAKRFNTANANGKSWRKWDEVELLRNRLPTRAEIAAGLGKKGKKAWRASSRRLLGSGDIGKIAPRCSGKGVRQANIFYSIGISACAPATHYHMVKQAIADKKSGDLSYVLVWTIDSPPSMRKYIDMGVDGIMTNYPIRTSTEFKNRKGLNKMMRL
jgi:hypothetical protein